MLLHPHFLSLQTHSFAHHPFSLTSNHSKPVSNFGFSAGDVEFRRRGRNKFHARRAVEQESEFEVDPDKAREALRKLDEELQSLAKKQIEPSKIRASDVELPERVQIKEEAPKFSEDSLPYLAFTLLFFTIFYNILFVTVIKPAIDLPEGPEPVAATSSVRNAPVPPVLLLQLPTMLLIEDSSL